MFNHNNQFFQQQTGWNPYQQGPIHPQHQMHRQGQFPSWHAFHHQQQQQMYRQHLEQEQQRQFQQQQQHQAGQDLRQQQQRHHQQQFQAHQQGQHLQQQQHQFQLHDQPHPGQHHLHQPQAQPQLHHQNQQHQQQAQPPVQHQNQQHHHLPAPPQQEHNQFYPQPQYQPPQPQPLPQPQEPHQHQHHQPLPQLQIEELEELNDFDMTHQVIRPQQPQQGVQGQDAHQANAQSEQGSLDDIIEILNGNVVAPLDDDDIEEIMQAGPSNTSQAHEAPPPQEKRRRMESGVDEAQSADAHAEVERLKNIIQQKDDVIESQRRKIVEQERRIQCLQRLRTIKVEEPDPIENAPQSSSPRLNAISASSSSPVLPAASPPPNTRPVVQKVRVKEEPRTRSPTPDRIGSFQDACDLWRSKYMDNILAEDGLTLDLKDYLFHPGNSRTVPQKVKSVRSHCVYKSLHPDKGKPNHKPWTKLEPYESNMWTAVANKIKERQLRQEREGLVTRRTGKAVPTARNNFKPPTVHWTPNQPLAVPPLFQNIF